MKSHKINHVLAFLILFLGVFFFRDSHRGILPFTLATCIVILFWYLLGMKLALTSLRNVFLLLVFIWVALFTISGQFSFFSSEGKTDGWSDLDMTPAMIASLKISHEPALEIYLEHQPNQDERYFKTGVFKETNDGLNYLIRKTKLDEDLMPEAKAWVVSNLSSQDFSIKLKTIETWWKKEFYYSLNSGVITSSHPLDEFLFSKKKGFCEHYAAALATLFKLSGTEARVAVGFMGGSWNPILHKLSYQMADAHAWVEAFDSSTHQWQMVDPTLWVSPGENQSRPEHSNEIAIGLFILLLSVFIFSIRFKKQEPIKKLLKKLEALEKGQNIELGHTISERIEKLILTRPKYKKQMQATLSLYIKTYYQDEPTANSQKNLLQSLSNW